MPAGAYDAAAPAVSGKGTGHFRTDRENITSAILGLGNHAATADPANLSARWHAAQQENCGFTLKVRNLTNADVTLEECALVMQHMESYECFLRHAVAEVVRVL